MQEFKQTELKLVSDADGNMSFVPETDNDGEVSEPLKCYHNELLEINNMSKEGLFEGYDEIKIITFSYDVAMIGWIMQRVQYAEIILGADFMPLNDGKTAEWVAEVLATSDDAARRIGKYDCLVKNVLDGDLVIHTSNCIVDHRKVYILRSLGGKTRVVKGSPNLTMRAWSTSQMETYEYDDSHAAYEAACADFETAWKLSAELPYEAIGAKRTDNPLKTNALIKKVKEMQKAVVLQMPDTDGKTVVQSFQYAVNLKEAKEKYNELMSGTGLHKNKDGQILFNPSVVEKMSANLKKACIRKLEVKTVTEKYPKLTVDFDNREMLLNGSPFDMHPSPEFVKSDLDYLTGMFEKYNDFVGTDPFRQKEIYYKLLTVMFASRFLQD